MSERECVISRRQFLERATVTAGALALGCTGGATGPSNSDITEAQLGDPNQSGFDHVVLVMMENRSFDHFLGWVPGADGKQAGLTFTDPKGHPFVTHALAPDYQGCGHLDPEHSFAGGRAEYNGGACDGWLRSGSDTYSIGYYGQADLPFLGRAATSWTTFDRYFAAIMGPTFPNRLFQHAGQTDRIANTGHTPNLPTIWDRLAGAGLSGRYYHTDVSYLALFGSAYSGITYPLTQFMADCAAGALPHLAFVDPQFLDENAGTAADDHPYADIRAGEDFLYRIYAAVTQSPNWPRTVLIFTFDEWGGFFDHVPPPAAPLTALDPQIGNTDGLRGFRIPVVLVSSLAKRGHVSHRVFDHTSVLRMVESRWHLDPLSVRDGTAHNLATVLNLGRPRQDLPAIPAPPSITPTPCHVAMSVKPDGARYSESPDRGVRFLAGRTPTASSEREAWRALYERSLA